MIARAKGAINYLAGRFGYEIRRVDAASTMEGALARIATNAPSVGAVIDVGASDGRWSRTAMAFLPQAAYLLIEAQPTHESALRAFTSATADAQFVVAAAGDREGTTHFDVSDPFGGAASEKPFGSADAVVPMTTIDAEVKRLQLPGPFLIKLDTHGFEREILVGAKETLSNATALIVEAYNFELRPGAMRFHELIALMDVLGFRSADIANVLRRPKDNVLWQLDLVFTRSDSPAFSDGAYG